jgi:hypothetical protein
LFYSLFLTFIYYYCFAMCCCRFKIVPFHVNYPLYTQTQLLIPTNLNYPFANTGSKSKISHSIAQCFC